MVVIKPYSKTADALLSRSSGLQALTAAALVLPGLMLPSSGFAEDEEFGFQYSHYQEGKRNLYGATPDNRNPVEVDSMHGGAKVTLSDRIKFAFNYTQDTWGGATPITTAPLLAQGNKPYYATGNDIVSGASPIILKRTGLYVDSNFTPVSLTGFDELGVATFIKNTQLVHTLSVASPETRKQGDFKLSYEWDEAALDVGGGISVERDYESRFASLGGRMDFNQKLTTANLGLSYTNSATNALIDHDALSYMDKNSYLASGDVKKTPNGTRLQSNRQDWAANLGLTQILTKDLLIQASFGYSRGSGYMANPYKVTEALFIAPNQIPQLINPLGDGRNFFSDGRPDDILSAQMIAFLERRPDIRNQWNLSTRFVQFINGIDAALHFDYHFATDDWGINAHTFEADWVQPIGASGWTITPRVRYYSQDAADFYHPYLVINQASTGNNDYQKLPSSYSSDQRLSGYGALSGGVSISKQFAKGVTLETGFEYYSHSGSLKIGGGGEGNYSNFNYYVANASLRVNLSALGHGSSDAGGYSQHEHHHDHGAPIPAGVMFGHMMNKPGAFMVGYRYMYSTQAGDMLHGSNPVADQTVVNQGCGTVIADKCYVTPNNMNMHMHMLDLMYAPTDWLNLMLMPQFVDMNMTMRRLDGAPSDASAGDKGLHIIHHVEAGHTIGGVGDTGMYALFKLLGTPNQRVNLTLGVTAPTGDIGILLRRNHQVDGGFIHYGMQLGSGTWDFKPSITYTGKREQWSWGAQVNGTKRLEDKNSSGYALGDIIQTTAWGSYNLLNWLSASVRGVYTAQGAVKGQYNGLIQTLGPQDYPKNYGGRFWDVGFGINAFVPSGDLAGNNLSFEWLQPVSTDYNGYQLNRDGALSATWNYAF